MRNFVIAGTRGGKHQFWEPKPNRTIGRRKRSSWTTEFSCSVGDDVVPFKWKGLLTGPVAQHSEQHVACLQAMYCSTYHENQVHRNFWWSLYAFSDSVGMPPHIFEQGLASIQKTIWSYWTPWPIAGWKGLLLVSHMYWSKIRFLDILLERVRSGCRLISMTSPVRFQALLKSHGLLMCGIHLK